MIIKKVIIKKIGLGNQEKNIQDLMSLKLTHMILKILLLVQQNKKFYKIVNLKLLFKIYQC